jgi:hypothetical protein
MTRLGGFDFAATCEHIVELALERAQRRRSLPLEPDHLP